MADNEGNDSYRPQYRGSGGSGGGGRKRRRDDDDVDRRNQRRKFEEPLSVRIRKQILAIAESPKKPEDEAQSIGKQIVDGFEDAYFVTYITEFLLQMSIEQPFKIPFAAAIVLKANENNSDFTTMILQKAVERLESYAVGGDWRSFKLIVRFLACLQQILEGDGVFEILDELFDRAADLQSVSPDEALGLELAKVIMLTIPYVLVQASDANIQNATALLEKTSIIALAPRETERLYDPYFTGSSSGESPHSQSALDLLQRQLASEQANGWELKFMPRLYTPPKSLIDLEDAPASNEAPTHKMPHIKIPSMINPGPRELFPRVFFSLYADQDVETVPPTSNLASSVIRDVLVDMINILDVNRNIAAKTLIDLDCYWAPGTFVKRATPFDKIKDRVEELPSTWKPEDLAVDAIFSQILQLPSPEHKLVFYHALITETCKVAPAAIAPSLGRAIRFLYRNIDTMDYELTFRFMDWFSHHLSNFDFRWKWAEWEEELSRSSLHPQKSFIEGVLDKEIRLSFAKRIRESLPEPYHPLIPSVKDQDIPKFKFDDDTLPYSTQAKEIVKLLRRKQPDSEIQPIIDKIHEIARDVGTTDPVLASTDVYITCICHVGAKSLSHVLSYIERSKDRLISLSHNTRLETSDPSTEPAHDSEYIRHQIISSVTSHWVPLQPGVAVSLVDKLLNYTILTPMSVVSWALATPENLDGGRGLAKHWVFEMVYKTTSKVTGRIRQIVDARLQKGLPQIQCDMLEKALAEERPVIDQLFGTIIDALTSVEQGATEKQQVDDIGMRGNGENEGGMGQEEEELCKVWGAKWKHAFLRKLAVEKSVVIEKEKVFPLPAEQDPDVIRDGTVGGIKADADGENGNNAENIGTNADEMDTAVADGDMDGIQNGA